jgi:hypothetical protein
MSKRFCITICAIALLSGASVTVSAGPQSSASSKTPSATDVYNARCAPLHSWNSYCDGEMAPPFNPALHSELRESTFEVQICKTTCNPRALEAPPVTAKLVTFVGTPAKMVVRRESDNKDLILDGYRLEIAPSAKTDEVIVHIAIDANGATNTFESDSVIAPGATQTLGNEHWQVLVTRTE